MPAATPAEESTSPSSTNSTSGSRRTCGKSRRNESVALQCVVAGRPSRIPAEASTNAPVQIDMIRDAFVVVSASCTAGSRRPSSRAGGYRVPGTSTVSASRITSRPWSGAIAYPPLVATGRRSGEHTSTS